MQDSVLRAGAAMLGWGIRLSLTVAVGLLMLGITAPAVARAAPPPTPTLVPARPAMASASALPVPMAGASALPVPTASLTPRASPSPGSSPTPSPSRSAAVSVSPSSVSAPTGVVPTVLPSPTVGQPPTPTPPAADAPPAEGDAADGEPAVDWQEFVPTDTADHLATMDRAARESGCGVPWQLLAAIARVESDFGRNMATSSAGALGYGQFLPSSWQAFGNDGNVYDYRAALPAIATYLCQSGLATDPRAALFAYNHADWYVDLVLGLAVRYDRLAPGAPTPDVLDLNPTEDESIPMHYASGRDVRQQAHARALDGQADWLGIPWRGRKPGSAIAVSTLQTTTLAMLRAGFGLTGDSPDAPAENQASQVASLADRAWAGSLFANPSPLGEAWSVAEIRERVERGQSVVALLKAGLLPGHPPSDVATSGDQPVVIIGLTPDGLIYSDPSFSSSLGYGLEVSDADFVKAWQAASTPLQALTFSTRPEPPLRDEHLYETEPRQIRAIATRTPLPQPSPIPLPAPALASIPPVVLADIQSVNERDVQPPVPTRADPEGDRSWVILLGAALFVGAAFGLKRWRARPTP